MARINKIFASGAIANVIFYELNGKPCARSKPARVTQTSATQKAGKRFGLAKTLSRLIRQSLAGLLQHYQDKARMYRVDAGMIPWMQTMQPAVPTAAARWPDGEGKARPAAGGCSAGMVLQRITGVA